MAAANDLYCRQSTESPRQHLSKNTFWGFPKVYIFTKKSSQKVFWDKRVKLTNPIWLPPLSLNHMSQTRFHISK